MTSAIYLAWWVEDGREEEFIVCTPYLRAIWMWKEIVRRCHKFFSSPEVVASNRVLWLKYEDLANDPISSGESIVKHLGLPMNARLRRKFQSAKITSIGAHKQRDMREIEAAEKIAKTELALYGYLQNPPASVEFLSQLPEITRELVSPS